MQDIEDILARLSKSPFRQRFKLRAEERAYLETHGLEGILEQARGFIRKRLTAAFPENDGKQTPFKSHPVFIAQHATATCCRGCLEKWHGIGQGHPLGAAEVDHVIAVIEHWLRQHAGDCREPRQPRLL